LDCTASNSVGLCLVREAGIVVGPGTLDNPILRHELKGSGARFLDFADVGPTPVAQEGANGGREPTVCGAERAQGRSNSHYGITIQSYCLLAVIDLWQIRDLSDSGASLRLVIYSKSEICPTVAQVSDLCFMANQRFAQQWDFAKAGGTISSQIENCRQVRWRGVPGSIISH